MQPTNPSDSGMGQRTFSNDRVNPTDRADCHEHLFRGPCRTLGPDGPLPFHLELERANREYRRAERDTFELIPRAAPSTVPSTARVQNPRLNAAYSNASALVSAKLGDVAPVAAAAGLVRSMDIGRPTARAGSIVDLTI